MVFEQMQRLAQGHTEIVAELDDYWPSASPASSHMALTLTLLGQVPLGVLVISTVFALKSPYLYKERDGM